MTPAVAQTPSAEELNRQTPDQRAVDAALGAAKFLTGAEVDALIEDAPGGAVQHSKSASAE